MAQYQPTRTETRQLITALCWENQGHKCKICNKPKELDEGILEHANRNRTDYRRENIGFVCYSCNQRKRPDFVTTGQVTSGKVERENVSGSESEVTLAQVTKFDSISKASREIQINQREDLFRQFLWENVGRPGELTREAAIMEGAEFCEVSPETIQERWLPKATSGLGPFIIRPATTGNDATLIVKLRPNWKPLDNERGRKDAALMQARKVRELAVQEARIKELAITADQVKEATENEKTALETRNRALQQRDRAITAMMQVTGKSRDEVMRLIESGNGHSAKEVVSN